jgi:hypothetical protein
VGDTTSIGVQLLKCVLMSLLAVSASWSTETLLTRANGWADTHGLPRITRASLLAWRRAGLVPPPRFRSLGRGHGSAQLWPAQAYRRLLQVNRLRADGLASHRLQRLHLWLLGDSVSIDLVRRDLGVVYQGLILQARRELHAEGWEGSAPDRGPSAREAQEVLAGVVQRLPQTPGTMQIRWGGTSAPLLSVEQALQHSRVIEVVRRWLRQLVLPNAAAFRELLRRAIEHLPEEWRLLLPPGLEDFLVAGIGLLADPSGGAQPLMKSLATCPDETLLDLRDAVAGWNEIWTGTISLARALAEQDVATFIGTPAPVSAFLKPVLGYLHRLRPVRTSGDGLVLLAWLLLLHEHGGIDGHGLARFAREGGGRRLFGWMALHIEELQTAAQAPPGSLAGVPSVLPAIQRGLWDLAFPERPSVTRLSPLANAPDGARVAPLPTTPRNAGRAQLVSDGTEGHAPGSRSLGPPA